MFIYNPSVVDLPKKGRGKKTMCKEIEKKNNVVVECGKNLFNDLCKFEDIDHKHFYRVMAGSHTKRNREDILWYIDTMVSEIDFYRSILKNAEKRLESNINKKDHGFLNESIKNDLEY